MKSSLIFCLLALVTGFSATAQNKYWSKFKDTMPYFEPNEVQTFDLTSYTNFDSIRVNIDVIGVQNRPWTQVYINDTLAYDYGIDIGFKSNTKIWRVKNDSHLSNPIIFRFKGYGWKVGLNEMSIPNLNVFNYGNTLVLNSSSGGRKISVNVLNVLGQELINKVIDVNGRTEVDLNLQQGYYIVHITEGSNSVVKKIKL